MSPVEFWDGSIWQTDSVFLPANVANNGNWNLTDIDLSTPGSYRVRINITDNAGNTSTSNQNPRTNFTVN